MPPSLTFDASRLLDGVQRLDELEAFTAARFSRALTEELAAHEPTTAQEIAALLDGLAALVGEIERFAQKAMRIRLAESRAVSSLTRQLHTYVSSMVASYATDLPLLRERVQAGLARVDPAGARSVAEAVVAAAARVLAERAQLIDAVFEVTRALATRLHPIAQRAADDRAAPEDQRRSWRLCERDLALVREQPQRIAGEATEARRRALPPVEEPMREEPEEGNRFKHLEVD